MRDFADNSPVLKTLQSINNPGNWGHANLAVLKQCLQEILLIMSCKSMVHDILVILRSAFKFSDIMNSSTNFPAHLLQISVYFFAPTVALFVLTLATQKWLSRDRELAICSEFQILPLLARFKPHS